jgi:AraC-like DNA-binding protein
MILAPVQDRILRSIVRRAALPDEDVYHLPADIRDALRFGYPRLMICRGTDLARIRRFMGPEVSAVPTLAVAEGMLQDWETAWATRGAAVSRIDDSALRLRRLMADAARDPLWIEGVFSDLTHIAGQGLPLELKGFSRRVMEFPARYVSLDRAGDSFGLSPGALKGRFRRRDLPSPSLYLRWFRLLAAGQILSDPTETTLSTSLRMGFASDGNFCRWVTAISGMNPSDLRAWNGRLLLLVRMTEECFPEGALEKWRSLKGLFVRQVA